ncbi:MAG: LPS export ABC transporter permease LptF [Ectothiorhodospiraceae bacterium]|nr:LPS export ABC transporter permease LptF [Chromatiales bacterium]MCP5154999.1 LPS export ABC transporter permease LptF [Ectothiorhodospiraceae bacterium]
MILQRYLLREVSQVFVAVLSVLLVVYLSHRFLRYLTEAAAGRLAGDLIAELIALKLATSLPMLVPLALYLAALLALARLHRDSEMVAMAAGGLGTARAARGVMLVGLLGAIVTAALSLVIAPSMGSLLETTVARARGEAEVTGIVPGRFKEFGDGYAVYVRSFAEDGRTMQDVFVRATRRGRQEIILARRAYQTLEGRDATRFMVLEDGHRYSGIPGARDFVVTRFERHGVRLDLGARAIVGRRLESIPTAELLRSAQPDRRAELQWRLSLPVSTFALVLLAIPLARTSPRQGRYAKLLVALLVYFLYSNGIGISAKLVEREAIPWQVGVWPAHLAVLAAACAWLAVDTYGRRRVLATLKRMVGR